MTAGINPARFSASVLDALGVLMLEYVPRNTLIFDPFAGEGRRLGALCSLLGYPFLGNDQVRWQDQDPRVRIADSTMSISYPGRGWPHNHYTVVTSVTYNNGMNDGFIPRDKSKRMTYTVAAGERLPPTNTGRWSGRSGKTGEMWYWKLHHAAVQHWPDLVMVNVKDSIRKGEVYRCVDGWKRLLSDHGYTLVEHVLCPVPSNGFGANGKARVDAESILVCRRTP